MKGNKVEIKEHFFGRNEYALRLQKVFYPIWITFHTWDMLTKFKPAWNLGFDTLTAYPGDNGADDPVDGYTAQAVDNATWANTRDGAGNASGYSGETGNHVVRIQNGGVSGFVGISRSIYCFDTSALTAIAEISASVLSVYGTSKSDGLSISLDLDIYTSTPASTTALVNGDFAQIGTTSQTGSAIAYASIVTSAYNDFTFNATGRGNVSKTSISKFGIRNANRDVADSEPGYVSAYAISNFVANFSDSVTNKPKLVITYTSTVDTTMIVTVGAFTLTGIATTFLKSLKMLVSNGAFTLTGIATTLKLGRKMTTAVGTFVLTGIDIVFLFGKRLIAEVGAFTLTGIDTTFKIALSMPTAVGEFILTGKDTLLKIGRKMSVAVGTFALTGIDVMFCLGKGMVVAVGAFILTGKNVTLKRVATMVTSVGSFVLSGKSVRLLLNGSIIQWINQVKNAATFTNQSKNSASYSNQSKNASSWTNQTKSDKE